MHFRKGELFNGPGGFALGARLARVEAGGKQYAVSHQWSNDYCDSACDTYLHNICPDRPDSVHRGDVRKLDLQKLGEIDAFIYGFPCNDFSNVGEKKGFDGRYGPLYTYGIQVLKHYQPRWFIAENVGGLQSANDGKAFLQILSDMTDAGYRLTPHLYNFADYGVPQANSASSSSAFVKMSVRNTGFRLRRTAPGSAAPTERRVRRSLSRRSPRMRQTMSIRSTVRK